MAILSGNKLLPIIVVVVVVFVVVVGYKSFGSKSADPAAVSGPVALDQVPNTPDPDADSPAETVRALSAQVADLQKTVKSIDDKNKEILNQKEDIRRELQSQQTTALNQQSDESRTMLQRLREEVNDLTSRVSTIGTSRSKLYAGNGTQSGDIPPGFGYDSAEPDAIVWVKPLDADATQHREGDSLLQKASLKTGSVGSDVKRLLNQQSVPGLGVGSDTASSVSDVASRTLDGEIDKLIRRYTVPRNATLMESTAFTALIGRVPIKGEVKDPVPFKVLVGAKNLTANGLEAPPELEGMVFSGVAVGDFTLRCTTGRLTSVTFIFADGTIRTENGSEREPLGTISDRQGIPCVSGELVTNAPIFLAERVGAMGLETAGAAVAASQTQTIMNANGGVATALTGSMGKYIMGSTVAGGASELRKWLDERQQQSFDAIFVEPGVELALHIDKELHIDYDPNGRKLRHETTKNITTSAGLD